MRDWRFKAGWGVGQSEKAEGQEESSFCEQKEAKKLYSFNGRRSAVGEGGDFLFSPEMTGEKRMDKVFLLLFVHKKKTFCLSTGLRVFPRPAVPPMPIML